MYLARSSVTIVASPPAMTHFPPAWDGAATANVKTAAIANFESMFIGFLSREIWTHKSGQSLQILALLVHVTPSPVPALHTYLTGLMLYPGVDPSSINDAQALQSVAFNRPS
jgi:hypothetical protein